MTAIILTDFQKAFDTIVDDVVWKNYVIDFAKHAVNSFKSYFSNRYFLFNLGNIFSQSTSLSCGVSQGSILGPLLS